MRKLGRMKLVKFKAKYQRNRKYREYKESRNVFSKERLGLADSAGGRDSSPNTTFSSLEETFTCLNYFLYQSENQMRNI